MMMWKSTRGNLRSSFLVRNQRSVNRQGRSCAAPLARYQSTVQQQLAHERKLPPLQLPSAIASQLNNEALHKLPVTSSLAEKYASPSPAELTYTGNHVIPITSKLHIVTPEEDTPRGIWPVFRLMDEDGLFRNPDLDGSHKLRLIPSPPGNKLSSLSDVRNYLKQANPQYAMEFEKSALLNEAKYPYADTKSTNTLLRAHTQIIRLREMDTILQNAQRQGRISFYMTCKGEEAIHMGAGSALELGDTILAQYREQGLLMWRGFTLEQFTNQCFSNAADLGKGRQMPVHYGSRALNYHTISSPLGTQLIQAVGVAYRHKVAKKQNVAACFFGEGCASTTDFHSALNFAATLEAPVVFFCRNNGYAISTPVTDQYRGDGVVSRAPGYGMAAIRIDGNDMFAVHAAVREARAYALQHSKPVLIEAMTYRQGHHSTSDDSMRYRSATEVQDFADQYDPMVRLESFLHNLGLTDKDKAAQIRDQERMAVLKAIDQAEKRGPPHLDTLFEDVYAEMTPRLHEQKQELYAHLQKYPDKY